MAGSGQGPAPRGGCLVVPRFEFRSDHAAVAENASAGACGALRKKLRQIGNDGIGHLGRQPDIVVGADDEERIVMVGSARMALGIEIMARVPGGSDEDISLQPAGEPRLAVLDRWLPSCPETKQSPRSRSSMRQGPAGPIRPGAQSPARSPSPSGRMSRARLDSR